MQQFNPQFWYYLAGLIAILLGAFAWIVDVRIDRKLSNFEERLNKHLDRREERLIENLDYRYGYQRPRNLRPHNSGGLHLVEGPEGA